MSHHEQDKGTKLEQLHQRMEKLADMLESLDPEKTDIDDIDRLIAMLDDLEEQCRKHRQQA